MASSQRSHGIRLSDVGFFCGVTGPFHHLLPACAIGLLIRNRFGLIISILGLMTVLLGYMGLRLYTVRQLSVVSQDQFFTQHPEFIPPHAFGLIGAKWWDLAVLGFCLARFIWETVLLINRSQRLRLDPS
jgi:hypothetical protein